MDGQTTVTHYPISFDHILLTLCSSFQFFFTPFFTALFILTNPSLFFCKFLGAEAVLSFCYLALKHTGLWDQPVTLYIDSRPRERIGKRTLKKLKKKVGWGN